MKQILWLCFVFLLNKSQAQLINKTISGNAAKGKIYAVIVGISDYGTGGIPHLKFADRDAAAFAAYLKSPAGGAVPDNQLKLLVNDQASLLNIDMALRWLIQSCGKEDLAYFYFSGHGDVENSTVNPTGFLLCYNAPLNNYNISSLEVKRVNDFANTVSRTTGGNIVLITDACHSGKLVGSENLGQSLVGEELAKVQNQEVRITSCSADEKSLESDDLGGGRGVFSYYLLNGFSGAADKEDDGVVTNQEIKEFLTTALSRDPSLQFKQMKQTPVIEGRPDFILSKTDPVTRARMKSMILPAPVLKLQPKEGTPDLYDPAALENYFLDQLKKYNLDDIIKKAPAGLSNPDSILHYILKSVKWLDSTGQSSANIDRFVTLLKDPENESVKTGFASQLAAVFDDRGQAILNLYLNGDEAELQKRMYYNGGAGIYDVYPRMFSMARILIGPENVFMNNILEVKQYYFAGLAARLNIYTSNNPSGLLKEAIAWEQKALALEKNGAFIYNELGVIYKLQQNYVQAEKYFLQAVKLLPKWAIPWLNLAAVYAVKGDLVSGTKALAEAEKWQPGLYSIRLAKGFLMEKKKDQLQAEESYRESISMNNRHYFPYERLGNVYMNTSRYALADSFFHESDIRKKGIRFAWSELAKDIEPLWVVPPLPFEYEPCMNRRRDTTDPYYIFYLADSAYFSRHYPYTDEENIPANAFAEKYFRKVISMDKYNFLSFHYMSELLYDLGQWQEAEHYLEYAADYYTDKETFDRHCDSLIAARSQSADPRIRAATCWVEDYKNAYPGSLENGHYYLMLARLHKTWKHINEAETYYWKYIRIKPAERIYIFLELAQLYEDAGRFRETEYTLLESYLFGKPDFKIKEMLALELDRFYKRVIMKNPGDPEWHYKAGNFLYTLVTANPETYPMHAYHVDSFSHTLRYQELPYLYGYNDKTQVVFEPRRKAISHFLQAMKSTYADSNALADIYYKTGDLYAVLKEADSAAWFFTKSLRLHTNNANTRMKLAENDAALWRMTAAMNQLDTLDQAGELNAENQVTLAAYKIYAGLPASADSMLLKSERAMPYTQRNILDLQGLSATLQGKYVFAVAFYQFMSRLNPADSDALYNLARVYALQGNNKEALKKLELSMKEGFRFQYVLAQDKAWEKTRLSVEWTALMKKYPPKIYPDKKELIPPKEVTDPDLELLKLTAAE